MLRSVVAVAVTLLLGGCLGPQSQPCGGGVCPPGLACIEDRVCTLATCGNAVIDPGERCDDGNHVSGDGCPFDCGAACGDGITDPDEQCDDGNTVANDGCAPTCTDETCGNGNVDPGEACDDDNARDGDGCTRACEVEAPHWSRVGMSPSARSGTATAYDAVRGKIVMFGGCASNDPYNCQQPLGDLWEWDGVTWVSIESPNEPRARVGHVMGFDPGIGKVVLFGGCDEFLVFNGKARCSSLLTDTWTWDGATWVELQGPPPRGKAFGAMAYDGARRALVKFGGCEDLPPCVGTNDTAIFDGTKWHDASPLTSPPARMGHAMAFDPVRGVMIVFGGFSDLDSRTYNDTWEWNGTTWRARPTSTAPAARAGHVLAFDPSEGVAVLVGGCPVFAVPCTAAYDDQWRWDGVTWSDQTPSTRPTGRVAAAAAFDTARGKLVLFGGASTVVFADTWELAGATWLHAHADAPLPRVGAMAFDTERHVTVLFGGLTDGFSNDTWEWTGDSWVERSPPTPPPARVHAALAYDATRGRTLLFGGYGPGTSYGDTWEWDGVSWRQRSPAHRPSARAHHALAFDPVRQQVVLFGGCPGAIYATCPSALAADTWAWNGDDWIDLAPTRSPSARRDHAMAFDLARGKLVLFGGSTVDDTWEWDGVTWTEATPAQRPPARGGHAMTYDASRQRTVLFGGSASPIDVSNPVATLGDTWTYDGTTWTLETPVARPPSRALGAMAYDAVRARVVLFGGQHDYFRKNDTWEWDGTRWIDRESSPLPIGRAAAAFAYFPPLRATVLFGGVLGNSGVTIGDTWAWNGERWAELHPSTSPPARAGHAMAYDGVRRQLVLFGGGNADTWTFDGTTWRAHAIGAGPSPNPDARPAMAFDRRRGVVVMYGGRSNASFADTWEWDGNTWIERQSATSPPPRPSGALAYDDARGVSVLFGGNGAGDTWEWDGDRWTELHPATSPPPREDARMTYNPARRRVVLIGGSSVQLPNDTWEWDGATWTQLSITPAPGTRNRPAVAWDETRGQVIVFGGGVPIGRVDNDTWLLGFGRDPTAVCRTGFELDGSAVAGCSIANCEGSCGSCGDSVCEAGEDCRLCPSDCGTCRTCGDSHCDNEETCAACPGDCGACP